MMEANTARAEDVGHIGGTSLRELSENAENWRDLIRRSDGMQATYVEVSDTPTRDPAYRPTPAWTLKLQWSCGDGERELRSDVRGPLVGSERDDGRGGQQPRGTSAR